MDTPKALSSADLKRDLSSLDGWEGTVKEISKTYSFKNYYETMAFVNAIAYIAHTADHHPDLEVGYNKVKVKYSTHDAGGVTSLDVQCAQAVEDLVR